MDKRLLRRISEQAWFHRYPRGLPVALFVLMAAVTLMTVAMLETIESDQHRLMLDRNATEVSFALQQREAEQIAYLRAAAALLSRNPVIDEPVLAAFHRDLSANLMQGGSLGLGWAPWVPGGQARRFEAQRRAAGLGNFAIRPAPGPASTMSTPIVFLLPKTPANMRAVGYDLYSEATRRAAMDQATALRRPVASGKVQLIQDEDRSPTPGFLIFMPVFEDDSGALRGFVYSPFRARDFLDSANRLHISRRIGMALYDGAENPANLLAESPLDASAGLRLIKPVKVGERTWTLVITEPSRSALSTLSQVTLLSGALMALLLLVIAQLLTRRAAEDRQVLEWQTGQAAIRKTLTRELNHRVKNTLANVLSIIALTKRRADSIDGFAESLTGRIRALSATHDLLTRSEWGTTEVREVIEAELAPYLAMDGGNVTIEGPAISLTPSDALSLGLAVHELATNAAKYGSLTVPDGRVSIRWRMAGPHAAELVWVETGGPEVSPPSKRGFGRELIEKIVAHELREPVDLRFDPTGVQCRLRVPVRDPATFALRTGRDDG